MVDPFLSFDVRTINFKILFFFQKLLFSKAKNVIFKSMFFLSSINTFTILSLWFTNILPM